jgi:hypothetical protein
MSAIPVKVGVSFDDTATIVPAANAICRGKEVELSKN